MRMATVVGILLVVLGVLGLGAGRGVGVAFGQGASSGAGMNGMGMMGGMAMMGGPFAPSAHPLSMDQAVQILRQWPVAHHVQGVVLDEVEAYTENFFGLFKERDTGRGAFTLVVDRYAGRVMPEMGGNMMWNTKYGTMGGMGTMGGTGMMGGGMMGGMMTNTMMGGGMMNGGMMGGGATPRAGTSPAAPLSEAQARQRADQFLSGYLPGARAGDGDSFYGFYHFDVLRGIRQVGMLDVNAETGQVWYHTWHGEFLQSRELTR